jgi:hypothetical protein
MPCSDEKPTEDPRGGVRSVLADHLKEAASTLLVRRQFSPSGAEVDGTVEEDQVIGVHRFVTEPSKVSYGAGLTINLGNYESARIDVIVSVPCYREELDDAMAFAKKRAEDEVEKVAKGVRDGHGIKKKAATAEEMF